MKKLLLLTLLSTPAFSNPLIKVITAKISQPMGMKVVTAALLAQQVKVYGKAIKDGKKAK